MSSIQLRTEEKSTIIGYKISGEPLLAEEAKTIFKKRLEKMEEGDYLTLVELEKEAETW